MPSHACRTLLLISFFFLFTHSSFGGPPNNEVSDANGNTALGWGALATQTAGVGNTAVDWGAGSNLKTGN